MAHHVEHAFKIDAQLPGSGAGIAQEIKATENGMVRYHIKGNIVTNYLRPGFFMRERPDWEKYSLIRWQPFEEIFETEPNTQVNLQEIVAPHLQEAQKNPSGKFHLNINALFLLLLESVLKALFYTVVLMALFRFKSSEKPISETVHPEHDTQKVN